MSTSLAWRRGQPMGKLLTQPSNLDGVVRCLQEKAQIQLTNATSSSSTSRGNEKKQQQQQWTVRGLANLGNTCFLNTVLQSLATLPPFVDSLQQALQAHQAQEAPVSRLVLECLVNLKPIPSSRATHHQQPLRPKDLHQTLRERCASFFQTHEQQDAEELLQLLLGLLTDELKHKPSSSSSSLPSSSSFFSSSPRLAPRSSVSQIPRPIGNGGGGRGGREGGREGGLGGGGLKGLTSKFRGLSTLAPPSSLSSSSSLPPSSSSSSFSFQNPLSGWLASALQCCECGHRRPIQNSAFIDIALPLSSLPPSSSSSSSWLRPPSSTPSFSSSSSSGSTHLSDILHSFASAEHVLDVECWSCSQQHCLKQITTHITTLEKSIQNIKDAGIEGGMEGLLSQWEEDLQKATAEKDRLQQLNPDEPFPLPPSLPPSSFPNGKEGGREEGLRRTFRKRLVFSRLPPLLCLHLGRRVFSPSLQKMAKMKDKVIFPLLMDMGSFAAYGGGMSADVALQQQQQQQLGREGGRGGRRRLGTTTTVVLGQAEGKGEGEEGEKGREEGLSNGNGTHHHDDDDKLPSIRPSMSSSTPSSLPPSSLRHNYLLQAVIVHHGSADSGHYTVFRRLSPPPSPSTLLPPSLPRGSMEGGREGRGMWVHISDEAVAPATVEEVLESEAYMLFYQSLDSLKDEKKEEEGREEGREDGEEEEEEEEEEMVA